MNAKVRRIEYFYATVEDRPGEAYRLLSQLSRAEVNLLAFNVIPLGLNNTQLVVFPESPERLARAAEKSGMLLTGPQRAFLIQGDDQLGALVELHHSLSDASINVVCSSGVTDGVGGYGYVLYVRDDDYDKAAALLGV